MIHSWKPPRTLNYVLTLTASIVGMVLGTAGFVMSLLSYLRDRPRVRVSLNLNMLEPRSKEIAGMDVVTNEGRRPIFVSGVAILPPGASPDRGTHLLVDDSIKGHKLGEGDPPYKCLVNKSAFLSYQSRWREIRAYAEDSVGRKYFSPLPPKSSSPPKWTISQTSEPSFEENVPEARPHTSLGRKP